MQTMLGRKWRTVDGTWIKEPMVEIAAALRGRRVVYVGTDSQQNGKATEFVSVIVVHEPTKGGRAFYSSESAERINTLRERLLKEAWLSVQLALEISPFLDEQSELQVHIDANTNTKFKSSKYVKELVSLVVSQGFKAMVKPEAWVAMHVADHVVKRKIIGR
jgi:predicted RNase H-related nuclease YkuK (DUF458 family)